MAWSNLETVQYQRFAASRPLVSGVTATPSAFDAAAGRTTRIDYTLADDASPIASVRVTGVNAQGVLVRTLVNTSQPTGARSVVWDGKNDAGVVQPTGTYAVKVNATDAENLAAGERTTSVALVSRRVETSYGYDRLSRLTDVTDGTTSTTYGYDPVGNRASRARGGTSTPYAYDRADRIRTAGSTAYTLNANGNLTARGSDTFGYDQANRLTSATVGGATSTYVFDGDGKRTGQTVGGVTTPAVYDVTAGLPVLLDDGSRKYVWGAQGLAYTVEVPSGAISVYHPDGLGSVRALTDSAGAVVQTYGTDEFGVPDAAQTQGSATQPLQYTGEPRDSTGLVYLRARMYDPASGRFVQRDGFGGFTTEPTSLNRYSYAANNPATLTDPSGENPFVLACAGGALGGAAIAVGESLLAGEKSIAKSQVLRGAATGCAVSMLGFGAGALIGKVLSRVPAWATARVAAQADVAAPAQCASGKPAKLRCGVPTTSGRRRVASSTGALGSSMG